MCLSRWGWFRKACTAGLLFWAVGASYAQVPDHFSEAPELAALVAKGELPPVAERLPDEPLVLTPYEEIGQYGGSWLRMMKGTSDFHAYGRVVYEQLLRWAPNPRDGVLPGLVKSWSYSDDGKTLTLNLRRGLKWSDGHPFSTDDIVFWWEKIAQDPNLTPGIPKEWTPGGEPMILVQVDQHTVKLEFAKPYPMAVQYLAFKGNQWPLVFERAGFFAPKHYLERYLPSDTDTPTSRSMANYALFEEKANDFNPERPVVSAWKVSEWEPGDHLSAVRNPYYWKVDTAGNQLPYIDKIEVEIFLNQEMLNFRAVSGVLQMQVRHFSVQDIDLLRDFSTKRGYRVIEYEGTGRDGVMLNLQYPGNDVLRKLFLDRRFRIALSLSIDREMICRLCFRGLNYPGTVGLFESSPDYVSTEGLPNYYQYQPDRASAMLDEMGLTERDGDGYRFGSDGEVISLIIETSSSLRAEIDMLEIIRSNWEAVGIKTTIKPEERTLYFQRVTKNGEHMIGKWSHEGVFPIVSSQRWFGTSLWDEWAHHWAQWFLSGGERGVEPPPHIQRLQKIEEQLQVTVDMDKRNALWSEVVRSHAENVWIIPTTERGTSIGVLANNFRNVPERAVASWITMTPGNLNPETFFIKKPEGKQGE
jgi:peptide/nickel transport system substrate-binding protein